MWDKKGMNEYVDLGTNLSPHIQLSLIVQGSKVIKKWAVPTIYIMTKQLSYASPTRNLQRQKDQKLFVNAVPTPAMKPAIFVPEIESYFTGKYLESSEIT